MHVEIVKFKNVCNYINSYIILLNLAAIDLDNSRSSLTATDNILTRIKRLKSYGNFMPDLSNFNTVRSSGKPLR